MAQTDRSRSEKKGSAALGRLGRGAKNALELMRRGRLGAPYGAPHRVELETKTFRLRRYLDEHGRHVNDGPPLLLVPPLMVTAEIYDISPELSAVARLVESGVDTWVVDFGAPEREEGGMERTLDDHVLAVDDAIEAVTERSGRDVHLAGYSQGGMFAYQAAAYRQSRNLASIITFGSPVDIRRNLPVKVHEDIAERFLRAAHSTVSGVIDEVEGLPGALTSRGFKLLSARKEIQQLVQFFGLLHDRDALARREPKRRFLGGEGFVAWPGPALRSFVDQVIAENRMLVGGFIVGGRSVTLADITVPVLAFVGTRDDIARPSAVRAIARAAPAADVRLVDLPAGHFGLVVGSRAVSETWPHVARWIHGDREPTSNDDEQDDAEAAAAATEADNGEPGDGQPIQALYDLATDLVDGMWNRLGDMSREVGAVIDTLRWQLPRLSQLHQLNGDVRINVGRVLAEQAKAIPDETFFLWEGRAYTYQEANARVNQVLHGLIRSGFAPGDHVGVYMDNHPDFLTAVAAINRLGGVAVLLNAGARGISLEQALEAGRVGSIIVDPAHLEEALEVTDAKRLRILRFHHLDRVPADAVDLDALANDSPSTPPTGFDVDGGRTDDLALMMYTSGTTGFPKAARVTNRRWALAALGTAAVARLTSRDTVYCCLPLHHATGMLVAVGGALAGGARLALSPGFSSSQFWPDVRRTGSTVVFYVGELCRYLVNQPVQPNEGEHPVRLFIGTGLRPEVWEELVRRFGPMRIIEFYGSTEGNVCLVNLDATKPGSVGRELVGSSEIKLLRWNEEAGSIARTDEGTPIESVADEPGLLVAKIADDHPLARFEGYADRDETEKRILENLFHEGDRWFDTGDLLRRDEDGDYWFVDRVGDTFRWKGENVSTDLVARVVARAPFVEMAAVYGVEIPGREGRAGMATVQLREGDEFDGAALYDLVARHLSEPARPRFVRVVGDLEMTESFKPMKARLREQGADPRVIRDPIYDLDPETRRYVPLTRERYDARAQ